ncbi:MAG: DUF2905 domain-containing protein [Deltaproteobacteria bacterium]|nr:DUF2905 domain-containing protein [Deltaproteobacteria bacterium]
MPQDLGKTLIVVGLGLAALGVLFTLGKSLGLGRLPGDFLLKRENVTLYFPLATSVLLSVGLSLVFWLFRR